MHSTALAAPAAARPPHDALSELELELGEGLSERELHSLRMGLAHRMLALDPGAWVPPQDSRMTGFLVAEGAIVRDVLVAGGIASDLLGPGDVAAFDDEEPAFLPSALRWTVSAPARVVLLGARASGALESSAEINARLLARATRQTATMAVQRAISQLPRVEQRLLALFWHLAERWGRVGRDGIVVRLALTHETLGRMVGARRPTVSLALKELATEGSVVRRLDGAWVLRQEDLEQLSPRPETGEWQPSDATVIADPGAAAAVRHAVVDADPGSALRLRLRTLDGSYAEQRRRVLEVLERCTQTRAELTRSRLRREALAQRSPAPRSPR